MNDDNSRPKASIDKKIKDTPILTLKAGITNVENPPGFLNRVGQFIGGLMPNAASSTLPSSTNILSESPQYEVSEPHYHFASNTYKAPPAITHSHVSNTISSAIDEQLQQYKNTLSTRKQLMQNTWQQQQDVAVRQREQLKQNLQQQKLQNKLGLLQDLNDGHDLNPMLQNNTGVFNQT